MANLKFGIGTLLILVSLASTHAQSVGKVTGIVGATAGSAAASVGVSGGASAGGASGGGADLSGLGNALAGPTYSGELPGRMGVKMGDKVIELRGAVGLGDQQNNYKIGAGIPF